MMCSCYNIPVDYPKVKFENQERINDAILNLASNRKYLQEFLIYLTELNEHYPVKIKSISKLIKHDEIIHDNGMKIKDNEYQYRIDFSYVFKSKEYEHYIEFDENQYDIIKDKIKYLKDGK